LITRIENFIDYRYKRRFDKLTNFRLVNAYMNIFLGMLLTPLIISLQGSLLSVEMISFFMILTTISVKANKFLSKYTIDELYKIGIFVHALLLLNVIVYFYDVFVFVYIDLIMVVLITAIFSTFSLQLNHYQAQVTPEIVREFNIVRNSTLANASILALSITSLIAYFIGDWLIVVIYGILQTIFTVWLFANFQFYRDNCNNDVK